jgi:hypothetical protein
MGINLPITSPLWIAQRIAEQLDSGSADHPKEEIKEIEKEPINPTAKIQKTAEKDFEGVSQMHKLHHQLHKNLVGGTNGITMDDTRAAEIDSQPVSQNEEGHLAMNDTAGGQGFGIRSTNEISTPQKNENELAMNDRAKVRIETNKIIIAD